MFVWNVAHDPVDTAKLEADLRDAYVELLSAQWAVERIKSRYSPEDVAGVGSHLMMVRAITAANEIYQYFSVLSRYVLTVSESQATAD